MFAVYIWENISDEYEGVCLTEFFGNEDEAREWARDAILRCKKRNEHSTTTTYSDEDGEIVWDSTTITYHEEIREIPIFEAMKMAHNFRKMAEEETSVEWRALRLHHARAIDKILREEIGQDW